MKDKNKLDLFNSIATSYDFLARMVFGNAIMRAQLWYLSKIPTHANVLVIGGGTGWWLKDLLKLNATCRVSYIEASSKMIAIAKRNSENNARIHFIHGTEESIPKAEFDVVITHFFLDMMDNSQLELFFDQVTNVLKPSAAWVATDFVNHRLWHRALLGLMYLFFRMLGAIEINRLPDWQQIFKARGYTSGETRYFFRTFIESRWYEKSNR